MTGFTLANLPAILAIVATVAAACVIAWVSAGALAHWLHRTRGDE